jgi:hypothetical protein
MQKKISLKLLPHEAADVDAINDYIVTILSAKPNSLTGFNIIKRSIDSRSKQPWINISINAFIDEPFCTGAVIK